MLLYWLCSSESWLSSYFSCRALENLHATLVYPPDFVRWICNADARQAVLGRVFDIRADRPSLSRGDIQTQTQQKMKFGDVNHAQSTRLDVLMPRIS
jgi:hypothetical protein